MSGPGRSPTGSPAGPASRPPETSGSVRPGSFPDRSPRGGRRHVRRKRVGVSGPGRSPTGAPAGAGAATAGDEWECPVRVVPRPDPLPGRRRDRPKRVGVSGPGRSPTGAPAGPAPRAGDERECPAQVVPRPEPRPGRRPGAGGPPEGCPPGGRRDSVDAFAAARLKCDRSGRNSTDDRSASLLPGFPGPAGPSPGRGVPGGGRIGVPRRGAFRRDDRWAVSSAAPGLDPVSPVAVAGGGDRRPHRAMQSGDAVAGCCRGTPPPETTPADLFGRIHRPASSASLSDRSRRSDSTPGARRAVPPDHPRSSSPKTLPTPPPRKPSPPRPPEPPPPARRNR